MLPDYAFITGDVANALAAGSVTQQPERLRIGGQEHFYLEGQIALAVPGEDGAVLVYSSTQHPGAKVRHIVARVLALPGFVRDLRVRRMGARLGGQETQATQWALIAAFGRARNQPGVRNCGSTATTTW